MSIIKKMFGIPEERAISQVDLWGDAWGDTTIINSVAGEAVNWDSSLTVTAVYACIRIISENIATLTMDSFRKAADETPELLRPKPAWLSFDNQRIQVMGQIVVSMLMDGNAYIYTKRDTIGKIAYVKVIDPRSVEPVDVNGKRMYKVAAGHHLSVRDILHIPGMMLPGALKGVSPIGYARETIGLTIAAQKYGASFFKNSAVPTISVEFPGPLSKPAARMFRESWKRILGGAGNAGEVALLTEGTKMQKISLNNDEAQFLQTRQFQVPDIARIYGVPPHLLADASNSTSWGSGLAEQNNALGMLTLRPWVERIEDAFTWLLRSEYPDQDEADRIFVKMNLERLMRGDLKNRLEAYAVGIENGIYNTDEVRAWEDLSPIGDKTMTLKEIGQAAGLLYLPMREGVFSPEEVRQMLFDAGANLDLSIIPERYNPMALPEPEPKDESDPTADVEENPNAEA